MSLINQDFILPLHALKFNIQIYGRQEPWPHSNSLDSSFSIADVERIVGNSGISGYFNLRDAYAEEQLSRLNLSSSEGKISHVMYMKDNVFHDLPLWKYRDFGMPREIKMTIRDSVLDRVQPYNK
ncbi:MAG: hypothetical protein Q7R87_03180 [Nanoarchaeota archaeon]|nr:hypothetical protein [Nanoarchaeota archaeon]